jgi:hypothetical protein
MVKIIFFTALVLFPFGQLFKLGIFNLFDIAVLLLAIITLSRRPKYPNWYRYFVYFLVACIFGLLIKYSLFSISSALYLLRLWSYSMVAVYVFNFYKSKNLNTIYNILLSVSIFSAIFGWLQYFIWPDLTALKYLGWDDHLLRMVGTFIDPTYLGLILVLGSIIAVNKKYYFAFLFLIFSIAFTYSRSSYLAMFAVFIADLIRNKNIKKFVIFNLLFLLFLFVLPKGIGEGTTLTRTVSGNNKLVNYSETLEIFKKSPVFGVGFNNICQARQKYLGDVNTESHSCNGADSSILFLLATTGVVGLILLIGCGLWIVDLNHSTNYLILTASLFAVFIHSLFANSIFYPHIMFWIFCLIGLQTEVNSKSS